MAQTYAGGNAFLCGRKRVKKSEILGHSCGFPNSFDTRERSGDEMAVEAVWSEPLSNPISLVTGNNTGIFSGLGQTHQRKNPFIALN